MDLHPWDNVVLDGRDAPGLCTVVTRGPGKFDVGVVFPFTVESWEEVQGWVDAAWKTGESFRPRLTPMKVDHPEMNLRAVRFVLVTGVAPPIAVDAPVGLEHLGFDWKMIRLSLVEAT